MVTGDAWRDEETLHTLRMLELTGHSDVPVARGAVFPLVRTQEETRLEEALDGKVTWLGAWGRIRAMPAETTAGTATSGPKFEPHGPYEIPPMPEGLPTTEPLDEDAAHFLIRQVRAHPHQVTIYAAGPLTNIALAVSIDPEFAALTKGIVLMGGSLNPQTADPEFATDPRHEFNFWFDPEAAHIVLRADWPRIDATTDRCLRQSAVHAGDARRHLRSRRRPPRATSPHGASGAPTCGTSSRPALGSTPRSSPKKWTCIWMWT